MQKVFQASDVTDAQIVQGLLEGNGINCVVKNADVLSPAGELTFASEWPEVWVDDDSDVAKAMELIANRENPAAKASDWTCPKCGEKIEGEFDACWKCGELRESAEKSG
jgi:predicted RNA-binding Zn-ribbon protein involved in translation (DUF1610 family)